MSERDAGIEAVLRASARTAAVVETDMRRGLTGLATVAVVAPLLGILGNVVGIVDSFRGIGTEKSVVLALTALGLSHAFMFTAFGLLVGLVAFAFYKQLSTRADGLSLEMRCASLDLANLLTANWSRLAAGLLHDDVLSSPPEAKAARKRISRPMIVIGVALIAAWLLRSSSWMYFDHYSEDSAAAWAFAYVLLRFGIASLFADLLWVRILHRGSSGRACIAALITLSWSVIEFWLGARLF
ncbi:MAG TPA: MotA/TolQ/ExbB proton channel family protein [Bryobacteraceae bacterium]|nr:MotA/TolQ/ExbB proton channel family protein [Bryobacteraceae bacterium]